MIERRFIKGTGIKVRSGGTPQIEGHASVFNEQYDSGWFIETIMSGAFARALREKQDVRCCFNHDPSNLLGRTKAGTLTLSEDTKGLKFSCNMNPDTRIATEVHSMIERRDLDGCSFSFQVTKQTWREEKEDPNDPKSRQEGFTSKTDRSEDDSRGLRFCRQCRHGSLHRDGNNPAAGSRHGSTSQQKEDCL